MHLRNQASVKEYGMSGLRRPFTSLYWRMTLSYFLVTLVAVLTVEVALTLGQVVSGYQSYSQTTPLEVLLQKEEAPKLAPYLANAAPDLQSLQNDVLVPLLYNVATYAAGPFRLHSMGLENRALLGSICKLRRATKVAGYQNKVPLRGLVSSMNTHNEPVRVGGLGICSPPGMTLKAA
jgi:hypothetical protein